MEIQEKVKETPILLLEPPKNLFLSFLLFMIALVLLVVTAPVGILYSFLRYLFTLRFKSLSHYLLETALVLDQAGNVIMQHLLNFILLKPNCDCYLFGNKKETISSVIGKNKVRGTLSKIGSLTDTILNWLDYRHSLNSINYDIKSKLVV